MSDLFKKDICTSTCLYLYTNFYMIFLKVSCLFMFPECSSHRLFYLTKFSHHYKHGQPLALNQWIMLILLKLLNLRATQMKCQKCWSVSPKYLEPSSHSGTLPFTDGSTTFQKWKNGAITRLFIPSIYSGNYLALIKSLIMGFHFSL